MRGRRPHVQRGEDRGHVSDHALAALVHERKSSAFALHSPLAFDRFSPESQ